MSVAGNAVTLPPRGNARGSTLGAIWLLFGGKSGDNAQVQALGAGVAALLGWDYKVKQLQHHHTELLLHLRSRPSLRGITAASRESLTPPWPDLVISAGRRNELVAQWIRQQAPATRLVHIGRPWCHPRRFDLVVATPQYRLETYPNVRTNALPLNQIDAGRIDDARMRWHDRFADLAAPRTVLLLGGNSGGYVLDEHQAAALATRLSTLDGGGSLLISSSRRTPRRFLDALLGRLERVEFVYRWDDAGANPYLGLLAWADRFVVTEDSVSMTAEALVTGKRVFIAPIDSAAPEDGTRWWRRLNNFGWKPLTHRLAMRLAPRRFYRDVRHLHQSLVAAGMVSWLGRPPRSNRERADASTVLPQALQRPVSGSRLQQQDLAASVADVAALFQTRVPSGEEEARAVSARSRS